MTQEPAMVSPCAKIFDHKWLDPNCVENGCQSLVLQCRLSVSEKRAEEAEREHHTAREQVKHLEILADAYAAERDSSQASLLRVVEALRAVAPYFEGEHAYDHPHCVMLRTALSPHTEK